MAYFNYFIKCIIRNISHKLCKPKVFLTVLLSVAILFGLKHFGYCAWTDGEIEACLDGLSTITNNQGVMISQLSSLGINVTDLKNNLIEIQSQLSSVQNNQSTISNQIYNLYERVGTLNTNILNIYNTLESNQKELIQELEKNNNSVVSAIEDIKNILQGDEVITSVSPSSCSNLVVDTIGNVSTGSYNGVMYFAYDKSLKYNITVTNNNSSGTGFGFVIFGNNSVPVNGSTMSSKLLQYNVSGQTSYTYQLSSGYSFNYIVLRVLSNVTVNIESVEGSVGFDGVQDSINQGNQLQQQQNQLQQEQNDFLRDDNVNVDNSTLPGDTTENITIDGFNSIFQQLYTTFTSGSSQDVVITIPFTNKSFTINSNSVYGNANLGFIKTIIETFWYFVISYFIVQDIAKKINKIKSGDIEHVQEYNIKEDIL